MTCRSDSWPLLGLAAGLALASLPASAQEPLLLRIRPSGAAPRAVGGGADAEIAAARAVREAVWERSAVRARQAIASVCTGCLAPPPAILPAGAPTRPEGAQTALVPADPVSDPAPDPASTNPTSTRGDP